jgi:shikimate dehydrogenase
MQISKDTKICISVAERPGNFGTTVHNAAYRAMGLDFIYKAFAVSDIGGAVAGIRSLGIRGCGVSMPFKEKVLAHMDRLDPMAQSIGAVNTIVNDDGRLTGYNTDAEGAARVLRPLDPQGMKALLLGAGGVAAAIAHALRGLGASKVTVANRTKERAARLAKATGFAWRPWEERNAAEADLLINATSIGMAPDEEESPVDECLVRRCAVVMDVIVTPLESRLIRVAESLGKTVIPGHRLSLFQAAAQFELYTGRQAPLAVMSDAVISLLAGGKVT